MCERHTCVICDMEGESERTIIVGVSIAMAIADIKFSLLRRTPSYPNEEENTED